MAIITISRQIAARGDEIAQELASMLGYNFIKRTDIEKRIIELGFPESKMPKYDERKPGFFASLAKDRDAYLNLSQYAIIEAASKENVVIIGRGAFSILKNAENNVSVRFIADDDVRIKRLMEEFSWDEKKARQLLNESDTNRYGFHKNFFNVDVNQPSSYDMVINSGKMSEVLAAKIVADYTKASITPEAEAAGKTYIQKLLQAQTVINKLIFEHKINIEFMHADIVGDEFILYGVSDSIAIVERALDLIKKELPEFTPKSSVSIVHDFKAYQ